MGAKGRNRKLERFVRQPRVSRRPNRTHTRWEVNLSKGSGDYILWKTSELATDTRPNPAELLTEQSFSWPRDIADLHSLTIVMNAYNDVMSAAQQHQWQCAAWINEATSFSFLLAKQCIVLSSHRGTSQVW